MTDIDARSGSPEAPERAGLSGGVLAAIFIALVAIGALVAWLLRDDGSHVAEVGAPAPSFSVSSFDGSEFDLSAHFAEDGRPVLLNLWASWCEPCKREFPLLSDYAASHPEVMVVGVAVQDQEEAARAFVEEMDPDFTVAYDADDIVRDSYPTFGLPATFLIDSDGEVVDILLAELTAEQLESLVFEN
ncbi:MAG TPA: redoxin domain-containing protein [Acidimicrobiia bacterium]|nr:redoxin domain-containing protein [Acidimicrobiia bacterium]